MYGNQIQLDGGHLSALLSSAFSRLFPVGSVSLHSLAAPHRPDNYKEMAQGSPF